MVKWLRDGLDCDKAEHQSAAQEVKLKHDKVNRERTVATKTTKLKL